jgi:hypothetical protein
LLFLGKTSYNPELQSPIDQPEFQNNEAIAFRNRHCAWRDYFAENPIGPSVSNWINLEKDQYYPIQGYLRENTSNDHMTVAVEFQTTETDGHHHARNEIQLLEMKNNGDTEKWELIIEQENDFDSGTFELEILDPHKGGDWWPTDPININSNNDVIKKKLSRYYKKVWESDITVYE